MDVAEYFKIKGEITKKCRIYCCDCPFDKKEDVPCETLEFDYIEEAVAIAEKWADDHKPKTRAQVFFERFPDAPRRSDGTPRACAAYCGFLDDCIPLIKCESCWNAPAQDKYQDWIKGE